ncbi:MAG: GIY-YIG nuclease family protein [Desulforhopalus sp.]
MKRQQHAHLQHDPSTQWYVYIVRCRDSTLYTGITTDLSRRLNEHNSEQGGARYTRPRRPVTLVYSETADSRVTASKREYQIKQLSVRQKLTLITQKQP